MRNREIRRRVVLPARMRLDGGWVDVSIRNLSSRGLMIHSAHPVERGTYVEVRRGAHAMIGRAVWRKGRTFGLHTQDRLDVEAIIARPDVADSVRAGGEPERRHRPRVVPDAERSVRHGRRAQFAVLGVGAVMVALLIGTTVFDILSQPFAAVRAAMLSPMAGER